jgi:hypothetical protein
MTCTFRDMRFEHYAIWPYTLCWEDIGWVKVAFKKSIQSAIKAQAISKQKRAQFKQKIVKSAGTRLPIFVMHYSTPQQFGLCGT